MISDPGPDGTHNYGIIVGDMGENASHFLVVTILVSQISYVVPVSDC